MSGGAFDYLFQCPPEQFTARMGHIQRMEHRLTELGYSEAARDTGRLVEHLRALYVAAPYALREVWRAVEWLDSGDLSIGQADRAAGEYESRGAYGTLDEESFVACECDRTEDVRLEGGRIADGEVARLRSLGWVYDGVTWVCPDHAKDVFAMVPHG